MHYKYIHLAIVLVAAALGVWYMIEDGLPWWQNVIFGTLIAAAVIGDVLLVFFKATTDDNRKQRQD
jgi:enterochelin esterase-like enzyme